MTVLEKIVEVIFEVIWYINDIECREAIHNLKQHMKCAKVRMNR
jgi:hypothetical protein